MNVTILIFKWKSILLNLKVDFHVTPGMTRGALIAFEGCDRVGKSTHVKKLAEILLENKIPNKILAFPSE